MIYVRKSVKTNTRECSHVHKAVLNILIPDEKSLKNEIKIKQLSGLHMIRTNNNERKRENKQ